MSVAVTPWLGDMDGDGVLDLVHATAGSVVRLRVSHPKDTRVWWNQYRGAAMDGVVPRR